VSTGLLGWQRLLPFDCKRMDEETFYIQQTPGNIERHFSSESKACGEIHTCAAIGKSRNTMKRFVPYSSIKDLVWFLSKKEEHLCSYPMRNLS
jgi:hypothetical protein